MQVEQYLQEWVAGFGEALHDYWDLTRAFMEHWNQPGSEHLWVVNQLSISCHLTSESALVLVAHGRLWDAEILIRSIVEGSVKLLFLCIGDEVERRLKAQEYWHDLPDIARLKRHKRVETLLQEVSEVEPVDDPRWKPISDLLLSPEEVQDLANRYPNRVRAQLESKWSFGQLVESLARSKSEIKGLDALVGLSYGYGIGSDLVHQNGDAVGIVWDRCQRDQERLEAVELAHGVGELSNVLTMGMIRALALARLLNQGTEQVKSLYEKHERDLVAPLHGVYDRWFRTEYKSQAP